ncbi:MAG: hypothetical protein LC808_13830, partial [Actinobacteria bacterium]|nr:hypothetical protein [Actinomycetota bacterium]
RVARKVVLPVQEWFEGSGDAVLVWRVLWLAVPASTRCCLRSVVTPGARGATWQGTLVTLCDGVGEGRRHHGVSDAHLVVTDSACRPVGATEPR